MDNYDDQDFLTKAKQKALELMGQTKPADMASVHEADSSLDQRPVPAEMQGPTYASPTDNDMAENLRNAKRQALMKGMDTGLVDSLYFKGNYPSQDEVTNQNRVMGAATMTGSLGNVGSQAAQGFGKIIKQFPETDNILAKINELRQNMTPENIEQIKDLSRQLYGKVTVKPWNYPVLGDYSHKIILKSIKNWLIHYQCL